MFSGRFSLKDCLIILYILSSIVAIIVLAVALGQCNKKCGSENFCNCSGPQYDGSAANPKATTYSGTYTVCPRKSVSEAYNAGEFCKTFSGV